MCRGDKIRYHEVNLQCIIEAADNALHDIFLHYLDTYFVKTFCICAI